MEARGFRAVAEEQVLSRLIADVEGSAFKRLDGSLHDRPCRGACPVALHASARSLGGILFVRLR